MDKKDIFRKVGVIMAELNEQYQYLSENPESLNDLELELFSANSDFLAEHVKVLKKLNLAEEDKPEIQEAREEEVQIQKKPAPIAEEKAPSLFREPVVETVVPERAAPSQERENVQVQTEQESAPLIMEDVKVPETAVPEPETVVQQPETLTPEPVVSSAPDKQEPEAELAQPEESGAEEPVPAQEKVVMPEAESAAPSASKAESPVINEVIIPERVATIEVQPQSAAAEEVNRPTVNDIIFAQKNQNQPTARYTEPVKDLKSIISLNDKLLFIRDLFNGYSLAYSEAVELVNRFDTLEAADSFLKANYAAKNNWAAKQATADKFYELLSRRFPA